MKKLVLILTFILGQIFCFAQINQGLVAHYKFDGNFIDYSGNNNHGTGFNTMFETDRFYQLNKSVYFNGTNSYVSIPNSASLSSPINSLSISIWFYLEQAYYIHNPFLTKSDQLNQSGQFSLNYCNCTFGNIIDLNLGNTPNYVYHSFNLNEWYHLVVTYTGQTIKFYENGIFIGQTSFWGNIQADELPLEFGRNMPGLPDYYHGRLDDVRIYNRALSETEIQELYHENGWSGRSLNTIIITHGFTGEGLPPIFPIDKTKWKHLRWQFAMADAVSNERDIYLIRKGDVYPIEATYSQVASINADSSIEYVINNYSVTRTINPLKDNVFIFDWTLESAINKHGFAEAAADVLAAKLVDLAKDFPFILENLHFIGHSRGCIVNSEAIQRLIYWADNRMLPDSVVLDREIHMTTLDPHPAGHWKGLWGLLVPMDDDRVNSYNIGIGVAGWKSGNYLTKYIDNYFETHFHLQQNPFKGLDYFPGLNPFSPSQIDLTPKLPINNAHSLVHTWYFGTVDTLTNIDEFGHGPNIPRTEWYNPNLGTSEGFYYSRNRNGNLSEIESVVGQLKEVNSDHKYGSNDIIFNGSFTKGDNVNAQWGTDSVPGWSFQGGKATKRGGLFNPAALIYDEHQELIHNLSYIPNGAIKITFRMRVLEPISQYTNPDELEVYFNNTLLGSFPITSLQLNYQRKEVSIQNPNIGTVGNLSFKLKKNQANPSSLLIDDVSLWHIKKISSAVACPVDFHIYDVWGNHTGPINDSTYVEEIPGSEYYIYEDSTGDKIKTVYLEPLEEYGEYRFVIESQDSSGFFTYIIEDYTDTSQGTTTFVFDSIAVEPNTIATCIFNNNIQEPLLEVDLNGDGIIDTNYVPNVITSIENDNKNYSNIYIPNEYSLAQNFPNPFNASTKIKYSIPKNSFVELKVFNLLGQEVATLVNEEKPAGHYEIYFDASDLPSGVYFYTLKAGEYVNSKKMILLK
ncbi:MAG: LamG-like jellyroll fold domain-containing protein [Ignavibacterium sp.]